MTWFYDYIPTTTFQLTTSQGGRHDTVANKALEEALSTHDLTRRSTRGIITPINIVIFQLTTSQGGRQPGNITAWRIAWTFNSRPHKEVDILSLTITEKLSTFNSRPHKEVDFLQFQVT